MSIIKMEDLNSRFTALVAQYISKGLTLNLNAMSGTQGELGRIALADDKVVYFIYMNSQYIREDNNYYDTMNIKVEMFVRDRRDLLNDWTTYSTIWLGKGELVYEEVYYEIADSQNCKVWVDSIEECDRIHELQYTRRKARNYDWNGGWKRVNKYNANTIIEIIKKKTGRKRVHTENIVKVEKWRDENKWSISYVFSGHIGVFTVKAA